MAAFGCHAFGMQTPTHEMTPTGAPMFTALDTLNQALFLRINAGEGTNPTTVFLAKILAEYTLYLIPLVLTACWLWGDAAKREWLLKAFCVAVLALFTNQIIGLFWQNPRPFVIGLGRTWIPHAADSSFPSDHVTLFASIGLTLLWNMSIPWGAATLVLGLAVAWARIFLGVHYPFDMLGAFGVAAFSFFVLSILWRRVGQRVTSIALWLYSKVFAGPISAGWVK
jgi:undecaprenyl-diphosphatase